MDIRNLEKIHDLLKQVHDLFYKNESSCPALLTSLNAFEQVVNEDIRSKLWTAYLDGRVTIKDYELTDVAEDE